MEADKRAKAAKRKRQIRQGAIAVVAAIAVILILAFATRNKKSSTAADTSTTVAPTTTVGGATTTSAASKNIVAATDGAALTGDTPCPAADGSAARTTTFAKAPPTCIDAAKTYTAVVETNLGNYTIALDAKNAPNTVNNFVVLARYHYYDTSPCHRIIATFMAQCGDPTGTGTGNQGKLPGYSFADENIPTDKKYKKGQLAMANSGPNTNGSQFFTLFADWDASAAPGGYNLFGTVTDGLDTTVKALEGSADAAAQNGVPPNKPINITKVTITET